MEPLTDDMEKTAGIVVRVAKSWNELGLEPLRAYRDREVTHVDCDIGSRPCGGHRLQRSSDSRFSKSGKAFCLIDPLGSGESRGLDSLDRRGCPGWDRFHRIQTRTTSRLAATTSSASPSAAASHRLAKHGFDTPELVGKNSILEARLNKQGPCSLPWFHDVSSSRRSASTISFRATSTATSRFRTGQAQERPLLSALRSLVPDDTGMSSGISDSDNRGGGAVRIAGSGQQTAGDRDLPRRQRYENPVERGRHRSGQQVLHPRCRAAELIVAPEQARDALARRACRGGKTADDGGHREHQIDFRAVEELVDHSISVMPGTRRTRCCRTRRRRSPPAATGSTPSRSSCRACWKRSRRC